LSEAILISVVKVHRGQIFYLNCPPWGRFGGYNYFASLGEAKMTVLFQISLISLVLISFVLVIGVPVAYGTTQDWIKSEKLLWVGSGVWVGLVFLVGLLNFFVV
jgi:photosystem II PsbZ protein